MDDALHTDAPPSFPHRSQTWSNNTLCSQNTKSPNTKTTSPTQITEPRHKNTSTLLLQSHHNQTTQTNGFNTAKTQLMLSTKNSQTSSALSATQAHGKTTLQPKEAIYLKISSNTISSNIMTQTSMSSHSKTQIHYHSTLAR